MIEHWAIHGAPLWLQLTKGTRADWCSQMGLLMGHVLEQVCVAAVTSKNALSKKRHTKQQMDDLLLPVLRRALRDFISPGYSPCHMDEFKNRHFTFDEETRRYTVISSPSPADAVP